jgi:hypothetical protein
MMPVQFDGISGDVSTMAATEALSAFVALLAISAVTAWWLARRRRPIARPMLAWFAGFATLAIIVSVTLFRDGFPTAFRLDRLSQWSGDGFRLLSRDPLGSSQFILNVALFVPAGAAWTLMLRRPLAVLVALSGASLAIEVIQSITAAGAPDIADFVANAIGAGIGVGAAAILNTATSPQPRRSTSRSRVIAIGTLLVVVVVVAVPALFLGASNRQEAVEERLRVAFEGTNRSEIETLFEEADPAMVFGAAGDWADGARRSDDVLEIRYPATFFGLHRCVFVAWDWTDVDFRKASGRDCTVFMTGEF